MKTKGLFYNANKDITNVIKKILLYSKSNPKSLFRFVGTNGLVWIEDEIIHKHSSTTNNRNAILNNTMTKEKIKIEDCPKELLYIKGNEPISFTTFYVFPYATTNMFDTIPELLSFILKLLDKSAKYKLKQI